MDTPKLGVLLALLFAVPARADDGKQPLRPDFPYRAEITDPITYEIDFSAVVTAPYHTNVLKVWMPIPGSDAAQRIGGSRLTTFPMEVEPKIATEPVYGNRFAYFEFREPKGAQVIRHRFTATVSQLRWSVEPFKIETPPRWPSVFEPYLEPQPIAETGEFQDILGELGRPANSSAGAFFGSMSWVDANLTYTHIGASLSADAAHAFEKRRGHCSDYHGLCATMGRSLGVPTRVTYGIHLYPKNSPSHCKLEAFLPPYGWVSFDVSETQKMIERLRKNDALLPAKREALAAAARHRLTDGFRENSWLLMTKGTNYELAPPASRPVRVVRTIYAEADGERLPEPDPANPKQREYGWMTVHRYQADAPVPKPFKDAASLLEE